LVVSSLALSAFHFFAAAQVYAHPSFGSDLVPVALELFGDQHRQRGHHALAELELVDQNRDRVVGADANERRGRIHEPFVFLCEGEPATQRQRDTEHATTTGNAGGLQEAAARERRGAIGRQGGKPGVRDVIRESVHSRSPFSPAPWRRP
jgi:hypothetical protein